jgi:hypothetical protein
MSRTLVTLLAAHVALGGLAWTLAPARARAQDPFAKKPGENDRNVGPLGIGAEIDGSKVTVDLLDAAGPAERAGVRKGDVVTGVDGAAFEPKADPVLAIVFACERAEAAGKKDAQVTLAIQRDGKDQNIKVVFPSQGKHSATCPKKCKKCRQIVDAGAAFLLSRQASDGSFPTELGGKTGKVVVTSLSALALIAAGGHDDAVQRAADWIAAKIGLPDENGFGKLGGGGGGNWNQVNWELAYGEILLAELARKKRSDLRPKVAEVAQQLWANQETSGGWAHGPGGPNALGYVELEIMSNWALMGLGLATKAGTKPDAPKLEKALAWIEETSGGDGGVGYSPRQGQKGYGEAGRTSGALVAWTLLGQRGRPFFDKMVHFYRGRVKTLETGHVSPCMHLLTGAIASYQLGARDWQDYMDLYRLPIMTARKPDGSFAATPTHESESLHSNTDFTVGPAWTTATYVLILALPDERLTGLLNRDKPEKPAKTATGKSETKPDRTATGSGKEEPKPGDAPKPDDGPPIPPPRTAPPEPKPAESPSSDPAPPTPPEEPPMNPGEPPKPDDGDGG